MKHVSAEPRCSNTILKPNVDIEHWPKSIRGLDRLPREKCGRPLLPIYDGDRIVGSYCHHCDGPLHTHVRGPVVTAAYYERRKAWKWPGLPPIMDGS